MQLDIQSLLLFRCVKLPEDNQQEDYDYYAIDIGNKQEVTNLINNVRNLVERYNIYQFSICEFINTSTSLAEFPPCDPTTFKLRPICETQCRTFFEVISRCFSSAVEAGVSISEFAALYDDYNCTNPDTHLPDASEDLFESQQNCYNVSIYNRLLGK